MEGERIVKVHEGALVAALILDEFKAKLAVVPPRTDNLGIDRPR